MENLKNIIECLLFVAEEPLSVSAINQVVDIADPPEIRQALKSLMEDYRERNGGFVLKEVAGGFQFRTRPDYTEWIKRYLRPNPPRLSKAALETLAIIAYKQPIIRSEVEAIRGVDCGGVLRLLMERKLIRILGRKEIPGRPLIYATTKLFLEVFDLKDLKDLPTPKEIEELTQSAMDGQAQPAASEDAEAEKAGKAQTSEPEAETPADQGDDTAGAPKNEPIPSGNSEEGKNP
ncbi:MAG: SMC-Scp complex subunit ScpB [Desulfobacteraceae bacterium]|nr:SMC-Scp complex subunit ScpB [Desulfobacteraceae bacterium]